MYLNKTKIIKKEKEWDSVRRIELYCNPPVYMDIKFHKFQEL